MPRTSEYNFTSFLMKAIPGDLWDAFGRKCKANVPPLTRKYAVLDLVAKFCKYTPPSEAKPERPARTRKPRQIAVEPQPAAELPSQSPAPDLMDSF